jgi:hypothetical protein
LTESERGGLPIPIPLLSLRRTGVMTIWKAFYEHLLPLERIFLDYGLVNRGIMGVLHIAIEEWMPNISKR